MSGSTASCRQKGLSDGLLKGVAFIVFACSFPGWLFRLSLLTVVVAFLAGCHNASGVSTSLIQEKENVFKRIAVLPFQQPDADEAARNAVFMVLPASVIKTENNAKSPERIVQDIFWEQIAASKKYELVSPDRTGGIYEQVATTSFKVTLPEAIRKMGEELDADGAVIGYVRRFRERQGVDYSVEKPASVSFEIHLYRCRDGVLVWRGIFDKTQTSLMENLYRASYFVKERGRWITATELAAEGMEDVLTKFPGMVPAE